MRWFSPAAASSGGVLRRADTVALVPLSSDLLGATSRWTGVVDDEWLMAYAAGVGASWTGHFDTTAPGGIVGHPMLPVAPEWALLTDPATRPDLGLDRDERARGVHATHHLALHDAVRPAAVLSLSATVVEIFPTPPGPLVTIRFDAVDGDGRRRWTTWMGTLYRGLALLGDGGSVEAVPSAPAEAGCRSPAAGVSHRAIDAGAAHVYTACARIRNPIHTDRRVALAAGLPDVVLHGTATLAMGVDAVLEVAGATPDQVVEVGGSFRGYVLLPSTIDVEVGAPAGDVVGFVVRNAEGGNAVRDGWVRLAG